MRNVTEDDFSNLFLFCYCVWFRNGDIGDEDKWLMLNHQCLNINRCVK